MKVRNTLTLLVKEFLDRALGELKWQNWSDIDRIGEELGFKLNGDDKPIEPLKGLGNLLKRYEIAGIDGLVVVVLMVGWLG